MKRAQDAAHNTKLKKDGIIQTSLVVILEKIKEPTHMVEVATHDDHKIPMFSSMFKKRNSLEVIIRDVALVCKRSDRQVRVLGTEVSKPRDSGLNFSNRSEIWQAYRQ